MLRQAGKAVAEARDRGVAGGLEFRSGVARVRAGVQRPMSYQANRIERAADLLDELERRVASGARRPPGCWGGAPVHLHPSWILWSGPLSPSFERNPDVMECAWNMSIIPGSRQSVMAADRDSPRSERGCQSDTDRCLSDVQTGPGTLRGEIDSPRVRDTRDDKSPTKELGEWLSA
jgi:hypothetical protein